MYVCTHNVTTDTNKWRAKSTDIYKTSFGIYKQAKVHILTKCSKYAYPQYEEP